MDHYGRSQWALLEQTAYTAAEMAGEVFRDFDDAGSEGRAFTMPAEAAGHYARFAAAVERLNRLLSTAPAPLV